MTNNLTKAAPPPRPPLKRRPSQWAQIFDECRAHPGEWRRVDIPLKKSTVSQVASDVRNAHKRDEDKRMTGLEADEMWDATWGVVEGEHYVWLCY
jgi:hypothetical protein